MRVIDLTLIEDPQALILVRRIATERRHGATLNRWMAFVTGCMKRLHLYRRRHIRGGARKGTSTPAAWWELHDELGRYAARPLWGAAACANDCSCGRSSSAKAGLVSGLLLMM